MARKPNGESSKQIILAAAVKVARENGLERISRWSIAKEAGVAESTVSYHFGQMVEMIKAVLRHAVENEIVPILADARANRVRYGVPMNEDLRKKVASYIAQ